MKKTMKLQPLIFLLTFGLTACFRVSSESAPTADKRFETENGAAVYTAAPGEMIPILEMNSGGLLGGSKAGKWLTAKEVVSNLKKGERYKIFASDQPKSIEITSEIPKNEPPCSDFFYVDLKQGAGTNGVALGAQVSWNPISRPIKKLDINSAVYKKAVSSVLASKGLAKSAPKITQIFQTDLDGDGKDEVVLNATFFKQGSPSRARIGDYSFILLRKVGSGGKVENTVLTGDFVKNATDVQAPAEYKISALADLNADGKMEAVVYARYYEGEWVEVFESKGNKTASVEELNVTCGL